MSDGDKPIGDVVGDIVQDHHQEGMTPNEKLRDLVEEFRKDRVYGIYYADKLEAVIDDE